MRYLAVRWHHTSPTDPVDLYSELNATGWEQRKVEGYADGRLDYAGPHGQSGSTRLGEAPVPPIEQIAAEAEFSSRWISRQEFETLWERAASLREPNA